MNNNLVTKALARFFTLKTIITLVIIITFCIQTFQGVEMPDAFIMIATAVITYYFCRDSNVEEKLHEHEEKYHKNHKTSKTSHIEPNPDKSVGE